MNRKLELPTAATVRAAEDWVKPVRSAMARKHMNMGTLAVNIGYERKALTRWFNGLASPKLDCIVLMYEALGIDELRIRIGGDHD